MGKNFKAGDLVRFVWNGILRATTDEIWVVDENGENVDRLDGSGGRSLYTMGHKFELIARAGEWGVLDELRLKEGDKVEMICSQGQSDWGFVENITYTVGNNRHHGLEVACAPIYGTGMLAPPTQIFRIVQRKNNEEKQKKTVDRSDNGLPNYNVTGWGNNLNAIPFAEQPEVKELSKGCSYSALGRKFGVATSTAWRVVKLHTKGDSDVIAPQGDYDANFRMRTCILANRHGARQAADMMGCHISSVYNWIKAYDMANTYFNPKQ